MKVKDLRDSAELFNAYLRGVLAGRMHVIGEVELRRHTARFLVFCFLAIILSLFIKF